VLPAAALNGRFPPGSDHGGEFIECGSESKLRWSALEAVVAAAGFRPGGATAIQGWYGRAAVRHPGALLGGPPLRLSYWDRAGAYPRPGRNWAGDGEQPG